MNLFMMYWRRALRKPGSILLWLAVPFLFMTLYQLAFGGPNAIPKTGLAIVDEDGSLVSSLVEGAFGQGPMADFVTVREAADLDAVEELFRDEKASAALLIPKGFGESLLNQDPVTLTLYKNPRHFVGPQIVDGITGSLVALSNGLLGAFVEPLAAIQSLTGGGKNPTASDVNKIAGMFFGASQNMPNINGIMSINVNVVEEEGESAAAGFNMATLFFPGLLMFGLLTVSLSLETRFLHDRVNKVTHRIVTTPIRPFNMVLQQRLYSVSFLYVMAIVSGLLAAIIWKIPPVGLVNANVISIALILFIVGINGSIFSLSSSVKATSSISSVVMMALVIIGGGFFPAEFLGDTFISISRLTPTGMANMGLTRSLTGRELTISIPVLFAYSGAFFLASIYLGRRRLI